MRPHRVLPFPLSHRAPVEPGFTDDRTKGFAFSMESFDTIKPGLPPGTTPRPDKMAVLSHLRLSVAANETSRFNEQFIRFAPHE